MAITLGDTLSNVLLNYGRMDPDMLGRHVMHVRQFRTRSRSSSSSESLGAFVDKAVKSLREVEKSIAKGKAVQANALDAYIEGLTAVELMVAKAKTIQESVLMVRTDALESAVVDRHVRECGETLDACLAALDGLQSKLTLDQLPVVGKNAFAKMEHIVGNFSSPVFSRRYLADMQGKLHFLQVYSLTASDHPGVTAKLENKAFPSLYVLGGYSLADGTFRCGLTNYRPSIHTQFILPVPFDTIESQLRRAVSRLTNIA